MGTVGKYTHKITRTRSGNDASVASLVEVALVSTGYVFGIGKVEILGIAAGVLCLGQYGGKKE